MAKVLGVLNFEPPYVNVRGLEDSRPISASSFLGRYRVADFMISNLTNSRFNNIDVFIKNRPRSLVEHISGTNYNMNKKKGKILLLHGEKPITNELYNTDINAFAQNMQYIKESNVAYVVVAPSHFIYIQDFNDVIESHIENGSDITVLYQSSNNSKNDFIMCDVLTMNDNKRVTKFQKNRGTTKNNNISLEAYVMSKDLFVELIEKAQSVSSAFWLSDIIAYSVNDLKIYGYKHSGYAACVSTLEAYYNASMEFRNEKSLKAIINENWPIYTMTNDSCPTLYGKGAEIKDSIIANGCKIGGTVINCIIGRNVNIEKGAVVKDSVILPDTTICAGVHVENAVIDRFAYAEKVKKLIGTKEELLYIKRGDKI